MAKFVQHTPESAPERSAATLREVQEQLGFIPNLYATLAESPTALDAYRSLDGLIRKSSLSALERELVILTVSVYHRCHYCVAAHTAVARMQELPEDVVEAIREERPIADEKLQALRRFATTVVDERGWVPQDELQAFLDAGYTRAQVLEVLVVIAYKTISNYLNHMAQTPLDEAFRETRWTPPAEREPSAVGA